MTHDIDIPLPPKQHDPIRDWQDCEECAAALRLTWNEMAETEGIAPMGLELIDWIRATALTKFDAVVRFG